jgi:hypothetical protein
MAIGGRYGKKWQHCTIVKGEMQGCTPKKRDPPHNAVDR